MHRFWTFLFSLFIRHKLTKDLQKEAAKVEADETLANLVGSREEIEDLLARHCRRNPNSSLCTPQMRTHLLRYAKTK